MISWHKPGQMIVCVRRSKVVAIEPIAVVHCPGIDEVFTIATVQTLKHSLGELMAFTLTERPADEWYAATLFEPVFPVITDMLRKFNAPAPERLKEDA